MRLTWSDNSGNERGHVIERSQPPGGDWTFLDSLNADIVRYYDSALSSQTTYYYRVFAWNNHGDSPYSNIAEVTTLQDVPLPPTDLRAVEVTFEMVSLEWIDNSDDELGFRIARRLLPWTRWDPVGEVTEDTVTFIDTSVQYTSQYGYRVSAFNAAGESDWSREVIVTTPEGPPGSPRDLHTLAANWDAVDLTWTRTSNNETGFGVERRTEAQGNFSRIAETAREVVAYHDADLEPETWYWYRVQAFNEIGASDYSRVDSVRTPIRAVFQDYFEDYAAGSPPVGNGWSTQRGGTSFLAVTDRDAYNGAQSVLFNDTAGGDSSYCMLRLNHDPVPTGRIDCLLKIAPDGFYGIMGADGRSYITFQLQFSIKSTLGLRNGGDFMQFRDVYPYDEWFHLQIAFDTDNRLYSVSVNDETIADNLNLQRQDHQANSQLLFLTYINADINYVYLDDVIIRDNEVAPPDGEIPRSEKGTDEGVKKIFDVELYLP